VRTAARQYPRPAGGGFTLLFFLTVPAAFLYLSGAAGVARHDTLYAALLAAVWSFYFIHDKLLRIRVFGPRPGSPPGSVMPAAPDRLTPGPPWGSSSGSAVMAAIKAYSRVVMGVPSLSCVQTMWTMNIARRWLPEC
jgi:hypothetical protein